MSVWTVIIAGGCLYMVPYWLPWLLGNDHWCVCVGGGRAGGHLEVSWFHLEVKVLLKVGWRVGVF